MANRNSQPSTIFVRDFLGGLNTRTYNQRINDNQISSGVLNSRLTEDGIIGKRLGVSHFGTIASLASSYYCGGIAPFYTYSSKSLLADVGPWVLKYSSGMFTPITGATFTPGYDKDFIMARGSVYIHNGVDMMTQYNGTYLSRLTGSGTAASIGASVAAGGVVAKFGVFFKTSQVVGGNPVYPNRAYVSQASNSGNFILNNIDGNSTDQAQWYDVQKDDGDFLTGMAPVGDSLIFFKERAIYEAKYNTSVNSQSGAVTSTANFFTSILPLNMGVGCVAHRTISQIENDIAFLSRSGPATYILGQQSNLSGLRLSEFSQPIKDILENINQSNLNECSSEYFNKRWYLSIPVGSSTYNNYVLVFNREYGVWEGIWQGLNANSFTKFIDPDESNTEKLLMADAASLRVGEMEQSTYTDFSNAVNADLYFKNFDLNQPALYKRWGDLTLFFRNTNATVTVSVYIDGVLKKTKTFSVGYPTSTVGIGSGVIGENLIGDAGGGTTAIQTTTTDKRIKINKRGRACQVRVQNNTTGEVFNIHAMEISYRLAYGRSNYPSANRIA